MVLRSSDVISTVSSFEDLYLEPKLCSALGAAGFATPSPVQQAALPTCLEGGDVVVQATSGTGKTVVISCTCLTQAVKSTAPANSVKALVLAPTRELAVQIQDITAAIGRHYCPEVACHSLIGGLSFEDDRRKVNMRADIVVGTPGRLISLIRSNQLVLSSVAVFVLDEADRLLEGAMCPQTAELYEALPRRKQVVALSATFGEDATANVLPMMKRPRRFDVRETGNSAPAAVRHLYACTGSTAASKPSSSVKRGRGARSGGVLEEKWGLLAKLMRTVMFNQALIFCNNPATAPALAARLNALGIPAAYVSARLPQTTRLDAVAALRSLRLRAAVTSDVLARGIDLEFINLVVNFDLPHDQDTYAHRLGRAGRFGSSALAVTLVSATEVGVAEEFAKSAGCKSFQKLPDVIPEEWYYRQPEGAAAEPLNTLKTLFMHDTGSAESECMEQRFPLSGPRTRNTHNSRNVAPDWQEHLSREGNYDRHTDMLNDSEQAEQWFEHLDQNFPDAASQRPELQDLEDLETSEGWLHAWDACTEFGSTEMQWLVKCSTGA